MSRTLLMVGTRKGLWLGTSDEARTSWEWTGPHFPMEEVYSVMVDTRGDTPAAAGGRLVELARPAGLALGRPRCVVGRDAQRRRPLPRGHRRHAGPGVAAPARLSPTQRRRGVGRAPSRARSSARPTAARPSRSSAGCGTTRTARSGTRASAARPSTRSSPTRRRVDRVLAALSTGGVYVTADGGESWYAVQHRRQGRVLPRRAQLPRVRPVRAQGRARRRRPRAALPPEPRRGLPLRRRRRVLAGHRPGPADRVRLRDGGPPAPGRHGVQLPDHRRRGPLARRRQGARLPHHRRRLVLGAPGRAAPCPTATSPP